MQFRMKRMALLLVVIMIAMCAAAAGEESVDGEILTEEIAVEVEPGIEWDNNIGTDSDMEIVLTEEILSTQVYSSSSSELASEYIASVLPQKRIKLRFKYPSGWRRFAVGTPERNLYELMETNITALASANDVTSSIFTINAKNIFKESFTAEDLGVTALFTEEGKVAAEAASASWAIFNEFVSSDHFLPVYYCLLADFPYDFFWLDTQVLFEIGSATISFGKYKDDDTQILLRGSWTIALPINQNYADIPSGWDGTTMLTDIDTDRYGTVTKAKNNITGILNAADGQCDTDYEK